MDKDLLEQLAKSLSDTKIDKINPDKSELDTVLALPSHQLSSLSDKELSQYIYILSQYLVFLTVQANARHIKFLEAKRSYELSLAKEMAKCEAKTVKEKSTAALLGSEELQKKEKDLRVKESDYILFEKVPEAIGELSNALKKELSIRQPNKFNSPYGRS